MKLLLIDILLTCCILGSIESIRIRSRSSNSNGPLVFTKWPPVKHTKSQNSLRHQLMYHLRANSNHMAPKFMMKRLPAPPLPSSHLHQQVVRPVPTMHRYAVKGVGHQLTAPSYQRPTISTPHRIRFHSSPSGPNTGEYVFENPFATTNVRSAPSKIQVSITGENRYSPIHTIPAPNLAIATGYNQFLEPIDNHLSEKDFNAPPPNRNVHQYQVTEAPVENEPVVAKQRPFEAPESELFRGMPPNDAFGQPSNTKTIPLPLDVSFITAHSQMQTAPQVSPLVQMAEPIPQQQLPDTYALPISNQPQLQQHLLQQQAMVQGVPMAVYNPSYLVQQSSNLLDQHRERLFKPAPEFLSSFNQPNADPSPSEAQPLSGVESVASAGQVLASIQKQQQQQSAQPNEFGAMNVITPNSYQSFQQIVQKPTSDVIIGHTNRQSQVQQPILSQRELANLLNIGSTQVQNTEQGFVASSYYQTAPDPQVEIENAQRQRENAITIGKANFEARKKLVKGTSTTTQRARAPRPSSTTTSAYEVHQKNLADTLGGRTKLMIVVPDEKKNELRRADTFLRTGDENISAEDNESTNETLTEDEPNDVTTDGSEEYFARENESVDRLAMEGENMPFPEETAITLYDI